MPWLAWLRPSQRTASLAAQLRSSLLARADIRNPQARLGPAGELGFRQAMQLKWVSLDKGGREPRVLRKVRPLARRMPAAGRAAAHEGARWGAPAHPQGVS